MRVGYDQRYGRELCYTMRPFLQSPMNLPARISVLRALCYAALLIAPYTLLCAAEKLSAPPAWTRYRGPDGAGQCDVAGIPITFKPEDYNWRVELPGVGNSSPVVWGNQVFITSADPETGRRYVLCFALDDGHELWRRDLGQGTSHVHTQNSFASSTPTVDADRVYLAWANPTEYIVMALDHNGKEQWRRDLGPFESHHGFGTSPIVYGGSLFITNDQDGKSSMVSLDCTSGAIRWQVPRKTLPEQNTSYATPLVWQHESGEPELIVCSWAYGVGSYDLNTGKTNWELACFDRRPVASPILFEGMILANCGDGGGANTMVAVRPPQNGQQPELVYKIDRSSAPYVPSLVAAGKLVFLWSDRGVVTCIDGSTGKVRWKHRIGGNFSGSPIRIQDKLYCISGDGDLVVLAAKDTYEQLGRTPLGEGSRATPVVADGHLLLRTDSHLISVGGNKPSGKKVAAASASAK